MKYNPVIKSLPEAIVAYVRMIVPSYDYYFQIIPKMGVEMERLGAGVPSRNTVSISTMMVNIRKVT